MSEESDSSTADLSYLEMTSLDIPKLQLELDIYPERLVRLTLTGNSLICLPSCIVQFVSLQELDISCNKISWISGEIASLQNLRALVARNNKLHNLPKEFRSCTSIEILNLSGNKFSTIPPQMLELNNLKELYLGSNKITEIPDEVNRLERLEVAYLGGNQIEEVPDSLKELTNLEHLILCDNKLKAIPRELSQLKNLRSLSLHKNHLTTLPMDIVMLQNLQELTLRDNPLVDKFVKKLEFSPPTLLELAGRTIKTKNIEYNRELIPFSLVKYLNSAKRCVNPQCDGVYFDSRVKCVKFVDFCGRYRLPLEEYLCSPYEEKMDNMFHEEEVVAAADLIKKVLLPS